LDLYEKEVNDSTNIITPLTFLCKRFNLLLFFFQQKSIFFCCASEQIYRPNDKSCRRIKAQTGFVLTYWRRGTCCIYEQRIAE